MFTSSALLVEVIRLPEPSALLVTPITLVVSAARVDWVTNVPVPTTVAFRLAAVA